MKSTGIIRRIDELGRFVIPKETRRILNIVEGDPMEVYVDEDRVILRKYEPSCACVFCGNIGKTVDFHGKCICEKCITELKNGDYVVPVSIAERACVK